ncbi:dihydrofolate reductase family protein [Knoellia subterranea]|uniref:Deaminase reductase n=1 Tax=Knoellia subterranea KCTC 19937 TaxID=1385521 RepID=A0A0A0JQ18_9MICO|nr:dihydrofolate reductase family protein [Knoellia subterranea]KGN39505.1 deaminase reductase [Knoellia subterranea KCTC 19937]
MSIVRVAAFSISLDGYGTGEPQTLEEPFGHAGQRLHDWMFPPETGGETRARYGLDGALAMASYDDDTVGAEIMGRRKYWPYPGDWTDPEWKGWWGDNPPFHTPVFVMTHHQHESIEMEGGTTFHFVSGTPEEVLAQARAAAGDKDVRIGGGPTTVRAFLAAGLIDHLHLVVAPIVLGHGESLWEGLEGIESDYDIRATPSDRPGFVHQFWQRRGQ